ncbi:uncharacterized protein LOC143574995 [Bidens hawaiensis]|uniref:uncharacterized protein LOC143574995 n=1 Tax=Bidens hawaiensis TaxID=980011 RepID=UPI00404B377F
MVTGVDSAWMKMKVWWCLGTGDDGTLLMLGYNEQKGLGLESVVAGVRWDLQVWTVNVGLLMTADFIDACLLELRKGNRPGTHFSKIGWKNIVQTMHEKTGITFDEKQIKNKWDVMKKEWKLYDWLMRHETGIGGTRSLIDASPEWWDEKIKEDKDFAKFRDANLEIFETHYAPLFRDSVAVGDQAMAPLQFQKDSNVEGKGDSDEISFDVDVHLFPSFAGSSSGKRKKSKDVANKRSTKSKASSLEEKMDSGDSHLHDDGEEYGVDEDIDLKMLCAFLVFF